MSDIVCEVRGRTGLITLNRPKALNALSLGMVRQLAQALLAWRDDPAVAAVAIRGQGRDSSSPSGSAPFGNFSAGGDIRFFHQAALAGDPQLEDFFTEEYELNFIVDTFPKPYVSFLDGIVIGGGMGIAGHGRAGQRMRVVTERTRMSMPETQIGLFPDVGGGYFLGRCPGRLGEYLALTCNVIGGAQAVAANLADVLVESPRLPSLWDALAEGGIQALESRLARLRTDEAAQPQELFERERIDRLFSLPTVPAIAAALAADGSPWALETLDAVRKRSPLMQCVTLEQLRRGRTMALADVLRMERDMVRHCFHLRAAGEGETVEGIRALAIDKDNRPNWRPARVEEVDPQEVMAFFASPWPAHAHPLRAL
ncbi:enoyl-CoA hydratase/isomerase family protein [Caenimonas terrae]|uniref:Enoyl-CoA hydratase/isomerase family protein n=1 Tax=Caenimonas terrae TaxID=696074 RepID=A0ABW0NL88_9BURK